MRHLGLFEGIGGFSLAASWMGWETVAWVEINEFCQKVLKKNFPEAKGHGDIKQFNGSEYRGTIDILTGGFPCQPYSTAGKRKGKEDDRHLWPEMLRVIREVQPRYVVGENVRGLTNWSGGLVFDEVQADLEAEGYQVLPFLLPACAVNAPHRRDRIWFVAYSDRNRKSIESFYEYSRPRKLGAITYTGHSESQGWIKTEEGQQLNGGRKTWGESPPFSGISDVTDTNVRRLERSENETQRQFTTYRNTWNQFPTVSPLCGGNDGVSNRMERIKALGNAVVPQVVYEIFKAIEQVK